MDQDAKKPVTAKEFFENFFSDEKLVTVSNGVKFLICKVDMQDVITNAQMGLPIVKVDPGVDMDKLPEEDRKKIQEGGRQVLRRLLIAGTRSPKFVEGPSNTEANEIGLDDPRVPSGLKIELQAEIYAFNGYTDTARDFFRLVAPGKLDGLGPSKPEIPVAPESASKG